MHFKNKRYPDFSQADQAAALKGALAILDAEYTGKNWPHILLGEEVYADKAGTYTTIDPNAPDRVIGAFQNFDPATMNMDRVVKGAKAAVRGWYEKGIDTRAAIIERAAELMEDRIMLLCAALVSEVGKSYIEAYAGVAEAIDFLRYDAELAREEYAAPLIPSPAFCGTINRRQLVPHGVFLTLDPFNFQVAIGTDQIAKALLMGNTVIASPSDKSSLSGRLLFQVFLDAFAMEKEDPSGILNWAPGGKEIAQAVLAHEDLAGLCFTGSAEVLDNIIETYGMMRRGNGGKLVIAAAETSGVDALYVHEDADLTVASSGAAASLCGLSGQKCSALSTIIAHESIADTLLKMTTDLIDGLTFGSTREGAYLGAVISAAARDKILAQRDNLMKETGATIAYEKSIDSSLPGFNVAPTILRVTSEQARDTGKLKSLRNTEIFGPVCTMIPAGDAEEAEQIFNASDFALTGGICSRSPELIEHAIKHFRSGNFYVNRKITGAMVGSEPFGGLVSRSSLAGISAGSRHALTLFYSDKTVSGFAV